MKFQYFVQTVLLHKLLHIQYLLEMLLLKVLLYCMLSLISKFLEDSTTILSFRILINVRDLNTRPPAWEADVLPLNYTRTVGRPSGTHSDAVQSVFPRSAPVALPFRVLVTLTGTWGGLTGRVRLPERLRGADLNRRSLGYEPRRMPLPYPAPKLPAVDVLVCSTADFRNSKEPDGGCGHLKDRCQR